MVEIKRERRSGPRVPVKVPVSVKTPRETVATDGVTRDLSTGGMFLYTDSHISEGSELEMVLILPPEITKSAQQWVCCRASVVRVEDSKEDGGSFGVAASIRSMEILPEIPS
jgi:c-di-GMP-binding flagellar brake protein YcgR